MAAYDTLITDTRSFLSELAANNNRDWWQAHKDTYDSKLKAPALAMLDELNAPLAALTDAPVTSKLFRPHRDVRFSKDKTPYNTHLHMMWEVGAGLTQNPVFFFGIGLDYVTAGAGRMGFDKPLLENWRQMVDLDTDRILRVVGQVESAGFPLREPELKRVPSPYDQDHPAARLLRMKGCVASGPVPEGPLTERVMDCFRTLWPLNALLISIAEA